MGFISAFKGLILFLNEGGWSASLLEALVQVKESPLSIE
jgi:hypothetical protein